MQQAEADFYDNKTTFKKMQQEEAVQERPMGYDDPFDVITDKVLRQREEATADKDNELPDSDCYKLQKQMNGGSSADEENELPDSDCCRLPRHTYSRSPADRGRRLPVKDVRGNEYRRRVRSCGVTSGDAPCGCESETKEEHTLGTETNVN